MNIQRAFESLMKCLQLLNVDHREGTSIDEIMKFICLGLAF